MHVQVNKTFNLCCFIFLRLVIKSSITTADPLLERRGEVVGGGGGVTVLEPGQIQGSTSIIINLRGSEPLTSLRADRTVKGTN